MGMTLGRDYTGNLFIFYPAMYRHYSGKGDFGVKQRGCIALLIPTRYNN